MASLPKELTKEQAAVIDYFSDLIADLLGQQDAQTEMLKMICRHVGVTSGELLAAADKLQNGARDGTPA